MVTVESTKREFYIAYHLLARQVESLENYTYIYKQRLLYFDTASNSDVEVLI
jgi:hypothetical protein